MAVAASSDACGAVDPPGLGRHHTGLDDDGARPPPSRRRRRRRSGRASRRRHEQAGPPRADLLALTSGLYHEPRLFGSEVALPLDHPLVYAALIDEERRDFLLIMEDVVGRGADPRDSTRPMTVEQVANGVRGLA